MARSRSKQKGAQFERVVCKDLSLWVTGGKHEDRFWRSAMSGGRATVGRKAGKQHDQHAGDITATHPDGHKLTDYWYVECKFYADLDLQAAMISGAGKLAQFWRDTCEAATSYNKMPMLIAKQNLVPTLMLLPSAHLLNPSGLDRFSHKPKITRLYKLEADVYLFDLVMQEDFQDRQRQERFDFLKPGELQRILKSKPTRQLKPGARVRIKGKVLA